MTSSAVTAITIAVGALYRTWRAGGARPWKDMATTDAVALGPAADEVYTGLPSLMNSATGDQNAVTSDLPDVKVGLSLGERSGWFWGFPTEPQGATHSSSRGNLQRVSGAVTMNEEGDWKVAHIFLSRSLPNEELPAYADTAPTLKLLDHNVPADAEQLIPLFHICLGVGRLDTLARREDVILIGTDASEVFEGAESFLKTFEPMRAQMAEAEAVSKFDILGGIHAAITPDGQTGYLATHLTAAVGEMHMPTFRLGWIFSRGSDGDFQLVCDHHAFPSVTNGR